MSEDPQDAQRIEQDRQLILDAQQRGTVPKLLAYTKLSGPGWLQSAITLGGGSLASSLFLGVLAGYGLMWLQPLAMILGIIMLSAIGYVALSTGERPFRAINKHVNPVLGWGWAIATLMANLVWCMPQFTLGTDAIQSNLAPEVLGKDAMDPMQSNAICVAVLFLVAGSIVWFYDSGAKGVKIFEAVLKVMVGVVVLSFFGVVIKMSLTGNGLPWNEILSGFIPNPGLLFSPAEGFREPLAATGEYATFWTDLLMKDQRNVMIAAAATAVGINMTFLLPYSMLKRGWDKDFRGLAVFDLSTGLFVPFVLATSCVVLASATQFHAKPDAALLGESGAPAASAGVLKEYNGLLDKRLTKEVGKKVYSQLTKEEAAELAKGVETERAMELLGKAIGPFVLDLLSDEEQAQLQSEPAKQDAGIFLGSLFVSPAFNTMPGSDRDQFKQGLSEGQGQRIFAEAIFRVLSTDQKQSLRDGLPQHDRELASMLVHRGAFDLAKSLQPLTGEGVAQYVFGIGVVGMAVSTIIILMLINGFVVCEMLGLPSGGTAHRMGCLLAGLVGASGPFLWGQAKFWLAVPTSVFGYVLLPIAFATFLMMMNSKRLLGENMPTGGKRLFWNLLMGLALAVTLPSVLWAIWDKAQYKGLAGLAVFIVLIILGRKKHAAE